MSAHRPPPAVLARLATAAEFVYGRATEIAAAARPRRVRVRSGIKVAHASEGPQSRHGVYAVVMKAERPAVLRVGRLGTFWMPDGYFVYVGSAIREGGIPSRTDRHLNGGAVKLWNVDHLKAVAEPVELWWSYSQDETLECAWAMTMADLPNFRCPAPRCGANDCKSRPAHLYHSSARPSAEEFAKLLGRATAGRPALNWQILR